MKEFNNFKLKNSEKKRWHDCHICNLQTQILIYVTIIKMLNKADLESAKQYNCNNLLAYNEILHFSFL